MAKVVSFINYKGGVGKTTLAVEIATSLSYKHEFRVLLVDLDPQTNATFYLMSEDAWDHWATQKGSLKDIFDLSGKPKGISSIIVKSLDVSLQNPKLHLVPSHLDLMNLDLELAARWGPKGVEGKLILSKSLRAVQNDYDFIICDCPPNLNLITQNAIVASQGIIIVTRPDYLAVRGIDILGNAIERLGNEVHEASIAFGGNYVPPSVDGIIFNDVRYLTGGTITQENMISSVKRRSHYAGKVFDAYLSHSQKIADRPISKIPIAMSDYAADQDYVDQLTEVAEEFFTKVVH